MTISPELAADVRSVLADLRRSHLASTAWPVVGGDLARLAATVDHGDDVAARRALLPLTQAAFEGKVRGRLAGSDRAAAFVTATKQTSSLPLVGGICAVLLLTLGYLLGGGLVLAATAAFALFIFAVALAGTRTNLDRTEERRARGQAPTREETEGVPVAVLRLIDELYTELSDGPSS